TYYQGKSAKESAHVFIQEFEAQEKTQSAIIEQAKETAQAAAQETKEEIKEAAQTAAQEIKETAADTIVQDIKETAQAAVQDVKETAAAIDEKEVIENIETQSKNIFQRAIETLKSHKLIAGVIALSAAIITGAIILLKNKPKTYSASTQTNLKPVDIDTFKKQTSKS
ncbi:hypothetical protein IJ531_03115, partial [bacterium]|nr:hypothetical protein [bacterium]